MKFVYEYRTSDNVPHRGTLTASNKEAAYDTLKAKGIRPGKVWEAPGLFNMLFGKGKRWIAIVVLLVALVGAGYLIDCMRRSAAQVNKELEDITLYEDRGQIYGAPSVLAEMQQNEYSSVFGSDGVARFLAAYAIPAKEVGERAVSFPADFRPSTDVLPVKVSDTDLEEVKHLKRIVNRMKRELGDYINDGGTVSGYIQRLEIRQKAEARIYERAKRELKDETDTTVWKRRNAELRAMGLPMIDL